MILLKLNIGDCLDSGKPVVQEDLRLADAQVEEMRRLARR